MVFIMVKMYGYSNECYTVQHLFLSSIIGTYNYCTNYCFMKSRITLLTLGVDDLERSLKFYREGMGFESKGIVGTEFEFGAVAFFDLSNGMKLALYPRKSIAHDCTLTESAPSPTEFTIGHNVNSKEEVDKVMAQAVAAGASIPKPAQETFWGGYAGYFQDPDGHLWEVAWNPQWKIED